MACPTEIYFQSWVVDIDKHYKLECGFPFNYSWGIGEYYGDYFSWGSFRGFIWVSITVSDVSFRD
jgi:hypothetical protein